MIVLYIFYQGYLGMAVDSGILVFIMELRSSEKKFILCIVLFGCWIPGSGAILY